MRDTRMLLPTLLTLSLAVALPAAVAAQDAPSVDQGVSGTAETVGIEPPSIAPGLGEDLADVSVTIRRCDAIGPRLAFEDQMSVQVWLANDAFGPRLAPEDQLSVQAWLANDAAVDQFRFGPRILEDLASDLSCVRTGPLDTPDRRPSNSLRGS